MLIDPEKLMRVRELVDAETVSVAISTGKWRSRARAIVAESLGFDLEHRELEDWHFASAISFAEEQRLFQVKEMDGWSVAGRLEAELLNSRTCTAASRETAEMAVLCRLLDPGVDIGEATDRLLSPCPNPPDARDIWRHSSDRFTDLDLG